MANTRGKKQKDAEIPNEMPLWFRDFHAAQSGIAKTQSEMVMNISSIQKKMDLIDGVKKQLKNHQSRLEDMQQRLAQLEETSREKNIVIHQLDLKGKNYIGKSLAENIQLWILRKLGIDTKVEEAFEIGTQNPKTKLVKFASAAAVRAIFKKGVLQKLHGTKNSIHSENSQAPLVPHAEQIKAGRKHSLFQRGKAILQRSISGKILSGSGCKSL